MNGKKLNPMSMVMNLLIRIDSIHDRRSIHHIFVSELDNLIIGGQNKAHETISFALNQAYRYIILNSRIFRSVILYLMNANVLGGKIKTRKCQSCNHFVAHIAHQIDRQSHNSGILHELCMSMDV